jgi:L-ascorbate metabolism protein UlaG (beta-lactamase superfamily)
MGALRWLGLAALGLLAAAALASLWLWSDRPDLEATGVPVAKAAPAGASGGVTVTWLGVTTLLFDDGKTQILTDGFFSRPGVLELLLDRPVAPDGAAIDRALAASGITRLAAVAVLHSHYDHAFDSAEVAKRTGARVLGSESTANLARGAGLPEEQIALAEDGATRVFGAFGVRFVRSRHAPLGRDGGPPLPGRIDAPLVPPAPISAWREGGSYAVVLTHPRGAALVLGSAGFVEGALEGVRAQVAFLGIGGLSRLGPAYAEAYWRETALRTGALRVFPIHYDDFTRAHPDGRPFPRLADDLTASLGWLAALARAASPPVRLERLPFGRPVALF